MTHKRKRNYESNEKVFDGDIYNIGKYTIGNLIEIMKEHGIRGYSKMDKQGMINAITPKISLEDKQRYDIRQLELDAESQKNRKLTLQLTKQLRTFAIDKIRNLRYGDIVHLFKRVVNGGEYEFRNTVGMVSKVGLNPRIEDKKDLTYASNGPHVIIRNIRSYRSNGQLIYDISRITLRAHEIYGNWPDDIRNGNEICLIDVRGFGDVMLNTKLPRIWPVKFLFLALLKEDPLTCPMARLPKDIILLLRNLMMKEYSKEFYYLGFFVLGLSGRVF
jgi:hypothetical protein